jgi:hypothetical protein
MHKNTYQWRWIVRWTVGALLPMVVGWLCLALVFPLLDLGFRNVFPVLGDRLGHPMVSLRRDVMWWVLSVLVFSVVVKAMLERAWFVEWRTTTRGKCFVVGGFLEGCVWWFAAAGLLGAPPLALAPHELMRWNPLQPFYAPGELALRSEQHIWAQIALRTLFVADEPFTSIAAIGFTDDGQSIWIKHHKGPMTVHHLNGRASHVIENYNQLTPNISANHSLNFSVKDEKWDFGRERAYHVTRQYVIEVRDVLGDFFWASPPLSFNPTLGAEWAIHFNRQGRWTVAWFEDGQIGVETSAKRVHFVLPPETVRLQREIEENNKRQDLNLPTTRNTPNISISLDGYWVTAQTQQSWDIIDVRTERILHIEPTFSRCVARSQSKVDQTEARWDRAWDVQNGFFAFYDAQVLRVVDVAATWAAHCPESEDICSVEVEDVVGLRADRASNACVWGLQLNAAADRIALIEGAMQAKEPHAVPQHRDTIKVLDVVTGDEVVSLVHENVVWRLAFDPAGRKLATVESDGMMHLWAIP